jgi:hypothetical protein
VTTEELNLELIFRDKDGAIRFLSHLIAMEQLIHADMGHEYNRLKNLGKARSKQRARAERGKSFHRLEMLKQARLLVSEAPHMTEAGIRGTVLNRL